MTLCIAKATKDQIIILSDTRLNDPRSGERRSVTTGTLKTTFLSPSVALAFAGDPDLAQATILKFRNQCGHVAPYKYTIEFLQRETLGNNNDYLIAFAGPKKIFKVSSGQIHSGTDLWIGDYAGFKRFQEGIRVRSISSFWEATVLGPDLLNERIVTEKVARMKEVCEDPEIRSVGDFFTVAVSPGGLFRFLSMSTLYFDDAISPILGPDGTPLLKATGENKNYRHSVWTPKKKSISAVSFNFPEAKRTFIFHAPSGGLANHCIDIADVQQDKLAREVVKRTAIEFESFDIWHM